MFQYCQLLEITTPVKIHLNKFMSEISYKTLKQRIKYFTEEYCFKVFPVFKEIVGSSIKNY